MTERCKYNGAHAFNINSSETVHFTIGTGLEATVPEFPSWSILPTVLIVALTATVLRKKMGAK